MIQRRGAGALLAVVAAVPLAVSLALPVATAQQTHGLTTLMGHELLFIGPFGVPNGQFGWFATPGLMVAIHAAMTRRKWLGGRGAAIVIVVMAMALIDALFRQDYPNDGGPGPLTSHGPGYFFWIAAVVLSALGLTMTLYRDQKAPGSRSRSVGLCSLQPMGNESAPLFSRRGIPVRPDMLLFMKKLRYWRPQL